MKRRGELVQSASLHVTLSNVNYQVKIISRIARSKEGKGRRSLVNRYQNRSPLRSESGVTETGKQGQP